jgi:hypothetical protein
MAISNAYGLILVILLLSYGLVEVPRSLWYEGDPRRNARVCELQAVGMKEELDVAYRELNAVYLVRNVF